MGDILVSAHTILSEMSAAEKSLLLFFETCAVDARGRVDFRRMNDADRAIAESWNDQRFIGFGRIRAADISVGSVNTHWCYLSKEAWAAAHEQRRDRADVSYRRREWNPTREECLARIVNA